MVQKVVKILRAIAVDDEDENFCDRECQFFDDPWPNEEYCSIDDYDEIRLEKENDKCKRTELCFKLEVSN